MLWWICKSLVNLQAILPFLSIVEIKTKEVHALINSEAGWWYLPECFLFCGCNRLGFPLDNYFFFFFGNTTLLVCVDYSIPGGCVYAGEKSWSQTQSPLSNKTKTATQNWNCIIAHLSLTEISIVQTFKCCSYCGTSHFTLFPGGCFPENLVQMLNNKACCKLLSNC